MKTRKQKMKMKKSNTTTFKNKGNKENKRNKKRHDGGSTHNKTLRQKMTTQKKVSLKKVNCSPKPKGEINHFTCYTN